MKALICALTLMLSVDLAYSQAIERPNENSIFGGGTETDAKGLDASKPAHDAFATGEVSDNALQIGGIFYQRLDVSAQRDTGAGSSPVSSPLQFDLFLDGRPSDRIRGFVDERLLYDSSRDQFGNATSGNAASSSQFSSNSGAPTGLSGTPASVPNNPQTVLDQAWLKFDIDHTVFVTAGKQHVKWGTSRFWNPTDFLNPQKRDPLLPYDLRLGATMLKFELPLEGKKTNLYAITLFDNPQPASTLGQFGEALRAETLIGSAEVGIDAVYRGNEAPTYGLDFSAPLGPFDIYAEGAYIASATSSHYVVPAGFTPGADFSTQYTSSPAQPSAFQTSGGVNYSFAWKDNRLATLGVEYFYNQLGYRDSSAYPALIFLKQYQPFYTGRDYAAIYLTAEGPDAEKHTSYTFSTLGNLSDKSFISRIDFSWRFLTYLTFEAYMAGHYGNQGGEFNFAMNTPTMTYQGATIPAISMPSTIMDFGLALRLSF